jgi:hypothetical protein
MTRGEIFSPEEAKKTIPHIAQYRSLSSNHFLSRLILRGQVRYLIPKGSLLKCSIKIMYKLLEKM